MKKLTSVCLIRVRIGRTFDCVPVSTSLFEFPSRVLKKQVSTSEEPRMRERKPKQCFLAEQLVIQLPHFRL
jgi:hypothetical protein